MLHLIIGRQGSGKTLYLVKKAYDFSKKGYNVYSNVHLNGINYIPLQYEDIVECRLDHGIVIIDEAHQLLPSRNSMSKRSRLIVDGFISMIRKKNLEVYMSTQTLRKIDIRIRDEMDIFYEAVKYAEIKGQLMQTRHNYNLDRSIPVYIHVTSVELYDMRKDEFIFKGNPYFPLYDSSQIIKIDD